MVKKTGFLNLFFLLSLVSQGAGLSVETRFSYNENDAIEERISSDGVITTYTYDSVDRLTGITYSNGEAGTQFGYNYLDQIDYIVDSTGTSNFSYIDNFHKVEQVAYSHGHDVNFYYNDIGDLYAVQADELNEEIYTYDSDGRIIRVNTLYAMTLLNYDPTTGRLDSKRLGNGILIEYDYDDLTGQVTGITQTRGNGGVIAEFIYSYYPNGLLEYVSEDSPEGFRSITYEYDNLLRLTKASYQPENREENYAYDSNGNRTRRWIVIDEAVVDDIRYSYNGLNQIVQAGDEVFFHDAKGNVKRRIIPGEYKEIEYYWNNENQLIRAELRESGTVVNAVNYVYNGLGQRIKRIEEMGENAGETTYVNNIGPIYQPLAIYRDGVLEFQHDPVSDIYYDKGTIRYMLNGIGGVSRVISQTGSTVESYRYDAFGNMLGELDGLRSPFKYNREQYDEVTGLIFLRSRYYDPGLGRFLSMDPHPGFLHNPQTLNPYVYVHNDPVNYVDPLGTCEDSRSLLGTALDFLGINIDINRKPDAPAGTFWIFGSIGFGNNDINFNLRGGSTRQFAPGSFSTQNMQQVDLFEFNLASNNFGFTGGVVSQTDLVNLDGKWFPASDEPGQFQVYSSFVPNFPELPSINPMPTSVDLGGGINPSGNDLPLSNFPDLSDDSFLPPALDGLPTIPDFSQEGWNNIPNNIDDLSDAIDSGPELAQLPEPLNGLGEDPTTPNETRHTDADPILMSTGELFVEEVDLGIPGRGFPFVFKRSYRSQYNYNGPLGHNWDFNYNQRLVVPSDPNSENVLFCSGEARFDTYVSNGDGTFVIPDGYYNELFLNADNTFTLRDRHGFKTFFDVSGRLTAQSDRHGNTMTFGYNGSGQLVKVVDTLGREIAFRYNAVGRLKDITDFTGRRVTYTYDLHGDLIRVRTPVVAGTSNGNDFPEGKTTRYTYSSGFDETDPQFKYLNHNLLSMTDGKGQTYVVNAYEENPASYEFDKITTQQYGESNQAFTLQYQELNGGLAAQTDSTVAINRTTLTDRNGNIKVYEHNRQGNLLTEKIQTNRNVNPEDSTEFVTTYTYNKHGELTGQTNPESDVLTLTFDIGNADRLQQGNLLSIVHTPGPRAADQTALTQSFTYEPIFNQINSATDARGNDATYVPQNGGTHSPDRYTAHIRFDYQEGSDLAALAAETGRTESEVQALLTAASVSLNLGDLNADGLTDQTFGNKIEQQAPDAILPDGSTQEIISHFTYNRFGQPSAVIDPEGNVTDYTYHPEDDPDGNGVSSVSSLTLAGDTGGYLAEIIADSRTSARRSPTAPEPVAISNRFFYDEVGNVVRTIDGLGQDTLFEVNALNQVVRSSSRAPFRYETVYYYDANNNVVRKEVENRDTNGPNLDDSVTYTYEYNILDDLIKETLEASTVNKLITEYHYDNNQNLERIIKPEGNQVYTLYDERNLPYQVTEGYQSPGGTIEGDPRTVTTTYDGNGNIVKIVDAADTDGVGGNEFTTIAYDGFNRIQEARDALGNVAKRFYDPLGSVVRTQQFGLNGGVSPTDNLGTGNALLAQSFYLYDELNRLYRSDNDHFTNTASAALISQGAASPGDTLVTTEIVYDRNSRVVEVSDDNLNSMTSSYDGLNRLIRRVDALDNILEYAYDANSNIRTTTRTEKSPEGIVSDETFVTEYTYDALDRLKTVTDNLNNVSAYVYDSRSNVIRTEDAMGNTRVNTYDGLNRILTESMDLRIGGTGSGALDLTNPANADGRILKAYVWDDNSRLKSLTDDNGNTTGYAYDQLDRLRQETFADNTQIAYTYDLDHNLATFTDANGSICSYTYDGLNRLTQKNVTRAAGVEGSTQQTFQYDGLSRTTRLTDDNNPGTASDDSTVELRYDSLSLLLTELQNGVVVSAQFDGIGRPLQSHYPDGTRVVERSFDALNRIKTIYNQATPAQSIAEYDYIGPGRTLQRTYANGTALSYHDGSAAVGYDGLQRRLTQTHLDGAQQLVSGYDYAYDKRHNRRYRLDQRNATADIYEYDSAYRLTRIGEDVPAADLTGLTNNAITNTDIAAITASAEEITYRQDGASNWVERSVDTTVTTFAPDNMNAYSSVGGTAQTHDDKGNLTDDGNQSYFYDAHNRLVRIEDSGSSTIASYTYDALGRRTKKDAGGAVTQYYYQGPQVLEEQDGSSNTLRQYVYGLGIDEVLELKTAGGDSYYYHEDALGSIVALTDADGSVVERYEYTEYGETTIYNISGSIIASSQFSNSYGYTGRRLDNESGLYYYRMRYYSAERGRFLQRDPLGYIDGMGLYAYVKNNPVNWVDFSGLVAITSEIRQAVALEAQQAANMVEMMEFDDGLDAKSLGRLKHVKFQNIMSKSAYSDFILLEQSINKSGGAIKMQSYNGTSRYATGSRRPDVMVLKDSDYKSKALVGGGYNLKNKVDAAIDLKTGVEGINRAWETDVADRLSIRKRLVLEVRARGALAKNYLREFRAQPPSTKIRSVGGGSMLALDGLMTYNELFNEMNAANNANPWVMGGPGGNIYAVGASRNLFLGVILYNGAPYFMRPLTGPFADQDISISKDQYKCFIESMESSGKTLSDMGSGSISKSNGLNWL